MVHAQRVEDLNTNRFAIGSLFGKRLFVDDDVKQGARLPDGTLKMISEEKLVSGELKYKETFNFIVRTVPVLLCNNIPSLTDLSLGMRRRLMVIPFDRTFTNADKDIHLFDRIWANELRGVLNRALAGYKRFVKRGSQFKLPVAVIAASGRWLQQSNPLPAFLAERCIQKADGRCLMATFYRAYSDWTREMGYTMTQTQLTVTRNLENLHFALRKGNKGQMVIGLALRNSAGTDDP